MKKGKITALVLAAGSGKRMQSNTAKQYMLLGGKPLVCYALEAFECSPVDEIIMVTGAGETEYCKNEIVNKYGYTKVTQIVAGGKERYHSVYHGLKAIKETDYVLIHDGARPFVTEEIICRTIDEVKKEKACVVGMPVKDTIKIVTQDGYSSVTPERKNVWMVQTPQAFSYKLILHAYEKVIVAGDDSVTDDAMVLEHADHLPVKLVEGSYRNIKITTPEDMKVAELFLKEYF